MIGKLFKIEFKAILVVKFKKDNYWTNPKFKKILMEYNLPYKKQFKIFKIICYLTKNNYKYNMSLYIINYILDSIWYCE